MRRSYEDVRMLLGTKFTENDMTYACKSYESGDDGKGRVYIHLVLKDMRRKSYHHPVRATFDFF